MSEVPKDSQAPLPVANNRPHRVLRAEVVRFFNAHFPELKCVLCNATTFEVLGFAPEEEATADVITERFFVFGSGGNVAFTDAPIVLITCSNCGYVYKFSARLIETWLAANPAKK